MSEWVEHDGKGMPVDGEALVICRFRDGDEERPSQRIRASYWDGDTPSSNNWLWSNDVADIIAYRVVSP